MTAQIGQHTETGRPTTPHLQLRRAAVGAYATVGVISLVLGAIYAVSSTFLPYHRDAIGADWDTLDTGTQVVLRALVHTLAAPVGSPAASRCS